MGGETLFSQEALQEDVLVHYGVKGMRWGIRKDRSSGGTKKKKKKGLLESIQKTYRAKEKAAKAKERAVLAEADLKRMARAKPGTVFTKGEATGLLRSSDGSTIMRSKYGHMSDEQLRATVQRLSLEKQYSQLTSTSKGKIKFEDVVKKVGIGATKVSDIIGVYGGAKVLGEKYGLTEKQTQNLENTLKVIEILAK